jgi:hypothetical protein
MTLSLLAISLVLNPQKGYKDTFQTLAWLALWLGEGVVMFAGLPASEL